MDDSRNSNYFLSREWDGRINVPLEGDLANVISNIKAMVDLGRMRYVFIGGVEIGDKAYRSDYRVRHVHICFIFINRVTKTSIIKNLNIRKGVNWYLKARNPEQPYSGWKKHHMKLETKIDTNALELYEFGELPKDKVDQPSQIIYRSIKEKQTPTQLAMIDIRNRLENGEDERKLYDDYPVLFTRHSEQIKGMISQSGINLKTNGDPHIWLYGEPGLGKTTILQVIYPKYYVKALNNDYFDCYDQHIHTHLLLSDVDINVVEKLGINFFKSICDESGYPINRKWKQAVRVRFTVLVSSNFKINDCVPEELKGRRENVKAFERRFFKCEIKGLLCLLGLAQVPEFDLKRLKYEKNTDPRKCFMGWDYLRNCPTGLPLKSAEEYQQIIREAAYGKASDYEEKAPYVEPTDETSQELSQPENNETDEEYVRRLARESKEYKEHYKENQQKIYQEMMEQMVEIRRENKLAGKWDSNMEFGPRKRIQIAPKRDREEETNEQKWQRLGRELGIEESKKQKTD